MQYESLLGGDQVHTCLGVVGLVLIGTASGYDNVRGTTAKECGTRELRTKDIGVALSVATRQKRFKDVPDNPALPLLDCTSDLEAVASQKGHRISLGALKQIKNRIQELKTDIERSSYENLLDTNSAQQLMHPVSMEDRAWFVKRSGQCEQMRETLEAGPIDYGDKHLDPYGVESIKPDLLWEQILVTSSPSTITFEQRQELVEPPQLVHEPVEQA
ncbi:hypothetical protein PM082_020088 [Marasmius tenuissimus]|nr:hypothetical protein PM082_020088 [Marasmius tenuissimus]